MLVGLWRGGRTSLFVDRDRQYVYSWITDLIRCHICHIYHTLVAAQHSSAQLSSYSAHSQVMSTQLSFEASNTSSTQLNSTFLNHHHPTLRSP